MSRIELQVPYTQKDEARGLGARWDGERKRWYVPDGIDPAPFAQWIPAPSEPTIRASYCTSPLARESVGCEAWTPVMAIMLPRGHEALLCADDPADDWWERGETATLLGSIRDVSECVSAHLQQRCSRYRVDYSQTVQSFYWVNHCAQCGAKLGDFETLEEPGTF